MLIKRTERQTRRSGLAAAIGNQAGGRLDRRSFLRKSGLVAGGLATIGALPLASVRKAEAAGPNVAGATIRKNICTHCSVGCTVTAEVSNGVWVGQEPSWDSADQPRIALRQGRRDARAGARRSPSALSDEAGERRVDEDFLGRRDQRDRRQDERDPRQVGCRIRSTGWAPPSSPTKARICSANSRPSGAPTRATTRRASAIQPPSPAWPIPGATAR